MLLICCSVYRRLVVVCLSSVSMFSSRRESDYTSGTCLACTIVKRRTTKQTIVSTKFIISLKNRKTLPLLMNTSLNHSQEGKHHCKTHEAFPSSLPSSVAAPRHQIMPLTSPNVPSSGSNHLHACEIMTTRVTNQT